MSGQKPGVAAVDRALSILEAFLQTPGDQALTLAQLADHTKMYKSTILRILGSLENFDYVRQLDNGRYKLSQKTSALGAKHRESFNLDDLVIPTLDRLVEQINESASFLIPHKDFQQILFRRNSPQRIRDNLRIGDLMSMDQGGASAKVIITCNNKMAAQICEADFCQRSFGERDPDMTGIAAPVFDHNNLFLGALSVTGPSFRITKKIATAIADLVTKESRKLSLALGATAPNLRSENTKT